MGIVKRKFAGGNSIKTNNFWNDEFPDGAQSKSADEVLHINQILLTYEAQEIPAEKRGQVADYILWSLLHETIEPNIKDKMEHLLGQLQELQAM